MKPNGVREGTAERRAEERESDENASSYAERPERHRLRSSSFLFEDLSIFCALSRSSRSQLNFSLGKTWVIWVVNCFIDSLLKRLSYFKKSVEHCVVIPAIT